MQQQQALQQQQQALQQQQQQALQQQQQQQKQEATDNNEKQEENEDYKKQHVVQIMQMWKTKNLINICKEESEQTIFGCKLLIKRHTDLSQLYTEITNLFLDQTEYMQLQIQEILSIKFCTDYCNKYIVTTSGNKIKKKNIKKIKKKNIKKIKKKNIKFFKNLSTNQKN